MATGIALIPVARASDLEAESKKRSDSMQNQPVIQGLAAHVRTRWDSARTAKRTLEDRMLQCLRQRNGEYDPEKLQEIREQGGSDIYINLTSVKCRAATSWLRDTLLGSGSDKPWAIAGTPNPDMPPEIMQELQARLANELMVHIQQGGMQPSPSELRTMALQMKDEAEREMREQSADRVSRMERKMEDQLLEGGWYKAFNEFLDDIVTFPYAVLKGPIKRKRKTLQWQNNALVPVEEIRNEWERVDPFMLYWAPWSWDLGDGYVIERHRLTAEALQALIDVPGYNNDAIRTILNDFGTMGMKQWLWSDSSKAEAEGKDVTESSITGDLVDALQLWDSVKGSLLLEWGLTEKEIPDPALSYPCEVWLIGNVVIRAVLNYDPLGSVDGKGVTDLCRDAQAMVNASGRALANNMGISSGPQVGINISRLPAGEDISDMHPWKIWQFSSSDYGDNSPPITFFQPNSNANELMAVFEKFSARADEDTMIPRYMTGENTPGAGRTSSGLSMLISNAGKGIKQVISNIDKNVITPAIERLYQDNLRYSKDPDLIGDVNIVATGATSLVIKEAEAVRRNEFLQVVLNSPVAQQIVGMDGTAELLRDQAKNLSGNVDRIVPDRQQLSVVQQQQQTIAQLQEQLAAIMGEIQNAGMAPGGMTQGPAPKNMLPDGSQVGGREGNMMSPRPNGV
jgi:hypothetical protein